MNQPYFVEPYEVSRNVSSESPVSQLLHLTYYFATGYNSYWFLPHGVAVIIIWSGVLDYSFAEAMVQSYIVREKE